MVYLHRYTREYIDRMVALVKEYTLMQPVMFPVHASLLKYSIPEMQRLLFQVPNSSLCVWSTRANPIESIDELLAIRKSFNIGQVFYKLPDEQLECFFSNTQSAITFQKFSSSHVVSSDYSQLNSLALKIFSYDLDATYFCFFFPIGLWFGLNKLINILKAVLTIISLPYY